MDIVTKVREIVESRALSEVRQQAAPMQAQYEEMERLGYTEKQGYTIASMDSLTKLPASHRMGFAY